MAEAVVRAQAERLRLPGAEVGEGAVGADDPLGLAGRAGGEGHVGEVVRRGGPCRAALADHRSRISIQARGRAWRTAACGAARDAPDRGPRTPRPPPARPGAPGPAARSVRRGSPPRRRVRSPGPAAAGRARPPAPPARRRSTSPRNRPPPAGPERAAPARRSARARRCQLSGRERRPRVGQDGRGLGRHQGDPGDGGVRRRAARSRRWRSWARKPSHRGAVEEVGVVDQIQGDLSALDLLGVDREVEPRRQLAQGQGLDGEARHVEALGWGRPGG